MNRCIGGHALSPCSRLASGKRKAISPIIATVLIIAVTLIASVAVGGFVFGIFGEGEQDAQVAVTGTSLLAADFTANPVPTTFSCVTAAPTIPYLTVTNTGSGSAAIASVAITWAGTNNAFSAAATCNIGASGTSSATSYLNFLAASHLTATGATNALAGQSYTGTITLTNGAQLLFTGTWQ
jgi:flagellin-like protein